MRDADYKINLRDCRKVTVAQKLRSSNGRSSDAWYTNWQIRLKTPRIFHTVKLSTSHEKLP